MTSAKEVTSYRSGHCNGGNHGTCLGAYGTSHRWTNCTCPCHTPKPVAEPPTAAGTTQPGSGVSVGLGGPAERPALHPGTPGWLRLMTASKVAAVLGLSPYESRFSLWHRMADLIPGEPDSDILRRGHYLEPAICAWFADQHPTWTMRPSGTWHHAQDERFAASPDRMLLVDGELRCLEAKSAADTDEWGEPGTDEIPAGYRAQGVWEMECSGTKTVHFAVLGTYLEFTEYVLHYDADEAAYIRSEMDAFMQTLPGGSAEQRPSIDDHTATYEAVKQLHPLIDGTDVDLDPETTRQYCHARHVLEQAKAAETYTKSLVADELGNGSRARFNGQTIARRQAKGEGTPYLVAGKHLPTFHDTEQEAAAS